MITILTHFYHAEKLTKNIFNKDVKPKSYALNHKIWLNSKFFKTK